MKKTLLGFLFLFMIEFQVKIYSQSEVSKIVNLSSSPINTFKESCAKCHGTEGSAYGEGFADMDDDALKEIVSVMMNGPAQLKPERSDIDAMAAYNKSLKDKKPFAIVMNSKSFLEGREDNLLVSLSPKAKLSINNKKIKIEKTGERYKLFYDSKKIKKLKITVTGDTNSASFNFPDKLWSE